ncbi:MAG: hypothetical protein Q7V63_09045 [Gammaproteobacteria bacterium]|nr:hypothetical protein [Gammaproteobacteria bacterium]
MPSSNDNVRSASSKIFDTEDHAQVYIELPPDMARHHADPSSSESRRRSRVSTGDDERVDLPGAQSSSSCIALTKAGVTAVALVVGSCVGNEVGRDCFEGTNAGMIGMGCGIAVTAIISTAFWCLYHSACKRSTAQVMDDYSIN